MREPVVNHEDPDLEYNLWGVDHLMYRGKLFTGTLLYDDTDPASYAEYKNGDLDGDEVIYYKNGKPAERNVYEDGVYVSGTKWYENGQLQSAGLQLYDRDGRQIRTGGSWLYPNGVKRDGDKDGEHYLFSSRGELAIKTIVNNTGDYKNTLICYDAVLRGCYRELLVNLYPEHDSLFYNIEYATWGWAATVYARDPQDGLLLYTDLAAHPNPNIAQTAKELLRLIRKNDFDAAEYLGNLGYHTRIE